MLSKIRLKMQKRIFRKISELLLKVKKECPNRLAEVENLLEKEFGGEYSEKDDTNKNNYPRIPPIYFSEIEFSVIDFATSNHDKVYLAVKFFQRYFRINFGKEIDESISTSFLIILNSIIRRNHDQCGHTWLSLNTDVLRT